MAAIITITNEYVEKLQRARAFENEQVIVQYMCEQLADSDWKLVGIFDGEEWEKPNTFNREELWPLLDALEIKEMLRAVDEVTVKFRKEIDGTKHRCNVILIPGNGNNGADLVADHSDFGEFTEIMDRVTEFSNLFSN